MSSTFTKDSLRHPRFSPSCCASAGFAAAAPPPPPPPSAENSGQLSSTERSLTHVAESGILATSSPSSSIENPNSSITTRTPSPRSATPLFLSNVMKVATALALMPPVPLGSLKCLISRTWSGRCAYTLGSTNLSYSSSTVRWWRRGPSSSSRSTPMRFSACSSEHTILHDRRRMKKLK